MLGSTAAPLDRSKNKATRVIGLFVGLMALAVTMMAINTSTAAAADHGFIFDEGRISLGDLKGLEIIDPGAGDAPATLSGQLDESGNFVAPPAGFVFPSKVLENIEATGGLYVNIVAHFSAGDDIEGTFDTDTGDLAISQFPLNANFDVFAAPATSGAPLAQCAIANVPLPLNSDTDLPGDPDPFEGEPFLPAGAAAATWASLPPVTGGGLCALAAGLLGGPGGLWLAGESTDAPPPPIVVPSKAPVINTKPDASTTATTADFAFAKAGDETEPVTGFECKIDAFNWSACNAGTQAYTALKVGSHTFSVRATNTSGAGPEASYTWEIKGETPPPPPPPAKLGNLVITPKNKAVKRGKKVVITVKVKNVGKSAATGAKVCVKAPARLVNVKKCQNIGSIAAGKTVARKFSVKVKPKAKKGKKAVLTFTATAKGIAKKTGKATVRVK